MHPLVSIIIPTFNSDAFLNDTLSSVMNQSYSNWECIIVDDGSDDATSRIISEFINSDERFSFYERPAQRLKGANACRNIGIEQSKGDYIMFLDADDIISKTCLEGRLSVFKAMPNADLVVANTALLIDDAIKDKSINNDPEIPSTENYLSLFLSYNIPWTIMSVLWNRESIETKKFDESLNRFQDIDFHINCLMKPLVIERLYAIDNYYRLESDKSRNESHVKSVIINMKIFYDKQMDFIDTHPSFKNQFRIFTSKLLFEYVFPNYSNFKSEAKAVMRSIYRSNLFSGRQKRILKTKEFLLNSGLDKLKYIGMHKFSTFMKRELER